LLIIPQKEIFVHTDKLKWRNIKVKCIMGLKESRRR
jgi:hypothetical protein